MVYHVAGVVAARSEAEFLARQPRRHAQPGARRPSGPGVGRFVLVSSMAAAGPAIKGRPLRGDEPPRPGHRIRPQQARGRGGGHGEPARPGRSSAHRWSTARATGKCSRCSGWPGSGVAPVLRGRHAGALRGARRRPRRRAGRRRRDRTAAVRRTYYACHPEVFTSAEMALAVGRGDGQAVRGHPGPRRRSAAAC